MWSSITKNTPHPKKATKKTTTKKQQHLNDKTYTVKPVLSGH